MKFIRRNEVSNPSDGKSIKKLSDKFSLSEDIIQILVDRGIDTENKIDEYLSDSLDYLHDPFLLTDMTRAVQRIQRALDNNEQITIWGDYDVDGTSAASILCLAFTEKGYRVPKVYIPDRHKEGYGLNKDGIQKILDEGTTKLLITVDCGITSKDEVEMLVSNGIDVIVTDHHEVPEEIPYCTAVIDPKRPGNKYPYNELCGAGVAFKLVQALFGKEYADRYVDIASFATVADVVPLTGENRIIVKRGLKRVNDNPRLGMAKLIKYTCSEGEEIKAYHYGFRLGPSVNASGRLAHAKYAVALMTTSNEEQADKIAKWMKNLNDTRKQIEDEIKEVAFRFAERNSSKKCLISYGSNWNSGVIGIVASRVMEEYHRPAIVFSHDPETGLYKGSARSIPGINMYQALKFADEYILQWGGHEAAAGLTVEAKHFNDFCKTIEQYMSRIDNSYFIQTAKFDTSVPLNRISKTLIENLTVFEPCGVGNPSISFKLDNVDIVDAKIIGANKNHFSCSIRDTSDNTELKAIKFNDLPPIDKTNMSITFKPQINVYNDKETLQLSIGEITNSERRYTDVEFLHKPSFLPLSDLDVTKAKEKQFNTVGIESGNDLLDYLPKDYLDFREFTPANEWEDGNMYATVGTVLSKKSFRTGSGFYVSCKDDSSNFFLAMFFGQNYAYNMFEVGKPYFFSGKVKVEPGQPITINPMLFSYDINKYKRLVPEYKKIKGMSIDYLDTKMLAAMRHIEPKDMLEPWILDEYDLCTKPEAIMYAHRPENLEEIEISKKRYLFDALFDFAFNLALTKSEKEENSDILFNNRTLMDKVASELPFKLTNDQSNAIEHIIKRINSSQRLSALLQGDVGCGKTIVALLLSVAAVENGYQSCIIAPTEVLANQHFLDFSKTLKDTGINVEFLAGSTRATSKKRIYRELEDGTINIIIGTHALLQDAVKFNNLGLLVIDEQHKFGVAQREKLEKIDAKPHVITMSATPIPRTLSMAMFGSHIDVITIYEKPAGRKPIITQRFKNDSDVNEFMLKEIRSGHQCYVVCPLIDESDSEKMAGVESVKQTVEKLEKWFSKYPTIKISDISGKMKKADIETEIDKFKNNETQILISTTIVEVGVNVPNATVMVLKNSERFGLAQAHQLRGRVGRGSDQGYMILQTKVENEPKAEALIASADGFEISKADLRLRGSGDFLGTKQSGQNSDVMLMLANMPLFEKIEKTVDKIVNDETKRPIYKENLERNKNM